MDERRIRILRLLQAQQKAIQAFSAPEGMTGAEQMRALGKRSDPTAANEAAAAGIQQAQDEAYVRENPVGARVEAFNAGVPFIGEWTDEAYGAVGNMLGMDGEQITQQARLGREAFARARPGQDVALRTAGGVVGSLPAVAAAAPAVMGRATVAGRTAAGAATGLVAGATEGAVTGAGEAREGERGAGAAQGAAIGGAFGAAAGMAAPMAAEGMRRLVHHLRGSDVAAIAQNLGVSPEAARSIKQALLSEDMGQAAGRIGRGGQDAMLLEAGPATAALGDAVANTGGAAGRIINDAVQDRSQKAATALRGTLDQSLGRPAGRGRVVEGIQTASQPARSQAYQAAYSTPIDYASAAGREIEGILSRIPRGTAQRAIDAANERIQYEGGARQIMAKIGNDGRVIFEEMPTAEHLDAIKRAFDDIARDGTDPLTRKMSSEARFASRIATDLREAHKRANPAYAQALKVGGDVIRSEEAVDTGYNALRPSMTREAVERAMSGAGDAEREAARKGLRQFIDDQMANARRIMSRPGTDVGEALKAVRDLSSRSTRDKLAIVLGPRDAVALTREIDQLATAFEIQAAMAQNSKTAVRQAVQGQVARETAPGVIGKLMEGEPINASRRLAQIFTGSTPEARAAREAGIYEEIARALTGIKGSNAQRALTAINKAMQGQPLAEAEARRLANLTAAALASGGYGGGTRMLEGR